MYNSEATILKCLSSVVNQTYSEILEVIIIDDGSSDNSVKYVKKFIASVESKHKFFLFEQPNQGPSVARNYGIAMANGEYIAFLDSDDYWYPDKIKLQTDIFANFSQYGLIATAYKRSYFNEKVLLKEISFSKLLLRNYFSTPTVIIRRDIFRSILFKDKQRFSEDYLAWLLVSKKYKCCYINKVLVSSVIQKYDYGDKGLSASMWLMERGELTNYKHLFNVKYINTLIYLTCTTFSLLKFFFRIIEFCVFRKFIAIIKLNSLKMNYK